MGVGIPSHLLAVYTLGLKRPGASGNLSSWKNTPPPLPPYWEGEGYVSLPLSRAIARDDSGSQTGHAYFYFEPGEGGEIPKASDRLLIDGVEAEVVAVRPPNRLIDYWKLDIKTGAA